MTRLVAAAALVAAVGLAWAGSDLLAHPQGGDAFTDAAVGGGDVRHFDRAAALFERAVADRRTAHAEAALGAQQGDARLRSRARTLLGVLAVADAAAHPRQPRAGAAAVAAFRQALLLDAANEDAAADLELLYLQRRGSARRQQPGRDQARRGRSQRGGGRKGPHRSGEGTSAGPGGGY